MSQASSAGEKQAGRSHHEAVLRPTTTREKVVSRILDLTHTRYLRYSTDYFKRICFLGHVQLQIDAGIALHLEKHLNHTRRKRVSSNCSWQLISDEEIQDEQNSVSRSNFKLKQAAPP